MWGAASGGRPAGSRWLGVDGEVVGVLVGGRAVVGDAAGGAEERGGLRTELTGVRMALRHRQRIDTDGHDGEHLIRAVTSAYVRIVRCDKIAESRSADDILLARFQASAGTDSCNSLGQGMTDSVKVDTVRNVACCLQERWWGDRLTGSVVVFVVWIESLVQSAGWVGLRSLASRFVMVAHALLFSTRSFRLVLCYRATHSAAIRLVVVMTHVSVAQLVRPELVLLRSLV